MVTSKRKLQAGQRIRTLIVDDSAVMRRMVTHALEQDPEIEVVGSAANGVIALARIAQSTPDVVSLDIEMPEMDGLETLRRIRRDFPETRVVMFSTLTERGASATLEALSLGADDYVTKASNAGSLDVSMVSLREQLIPKIKQYFVLPTQTASSVSPKVQLPGSVLDAVRPRSLREMAPQVVAIGVSTGGPTALAAIIPGFPADFPLPVLIVQHMPPLFTRLLCERLQDKCKLVVREATHGERVEPGKILVAPGDFHMKVVNARPGSAPEILLDQTPPENSCRPAVDALFFSLTQVYGGAVVAAILTGMGQDGLRGAASLKAGGACILAQDEASSAVWGMPRAIAEAKLADAILPLDSMVPEILRRTASAVRKPQFALKEAAPWPR